jgi:hypothetical protein
MAYIIAEAIAGTQPIATTSTVKNHPLGKIVRAIDPVYGEGEFIYLLGVGSTVVGSAVSYNISTYQTALAPVGTGVPRAIAFAMSANVASQYGWYQISGLVVAKKALATSMATGISVGIKTIGLVSATASLQNLHGAVVAAVSSAKSSTSLTTILLMVNRPTMQGPETIA